MADSPPRSPADAPAQPDDYIEVNEAPEDDDAGQAQAERPAGGRPAGAAAAEPATSAGHAEHPRAGPVDAAPAEEARGHHAPDALEPAAEVLAAAASGSAAGDPPAGGMDSAEPGSRDPTPAATAPATADDAGSASARASPASSAPAATSSARASPVMAAAREANDSEDDGDWGFPENGPYSAAPRVKPLAGMAPRLTSEQLAAHEMDDVLSPLPDDVPGRDRVLSVAAREKERFILRRYLSVCTFCSLLARIETRFEKKVQIYSPVVVRPQNLQAQMPRKPPPPSYG
mgnify:CR=1 FL=1